MQFVYQWCLDIFFFNQYGVKAAFQTPQEGRWFLLPEHADFMVDSTYSVRRTCSFSGLETPSMSFREQQYSIRNFRFSFLSWFFVILTVHFWPNRHCRGWLSGYFFAYHCDSMTDHHNHNIAGSRIGNRLVLRTRDCWGAHHWTLLASWTGISVSGIFWIFNICPQLYHFRWFTYLK